MFQENTEKALTHYGIEDLEERLKELQRQARGKRPLIFKHVAPWDNLLAVQTEIGRRKNISPPLAIKKS